MKIVSENINVVVRDGNVLSTKKLKDVEYNHHFAFKDVENKVGVALKLGKEKYEFLFTETDCGRAFDYLMEL